MKNMKNDVRHGFNMKAIADKKRPPRPRVEFVGSNR
jgi:hypothetical protein